MTRTDRIAAVICAWLALGLIIVWAMNGIQSGGTHVAAGLMVLLAVLGTAAATFTLFVPWGDRRSESARGMAFVSYIFALGVGFMDGVWGLIRAAIAWATQG